MTTSDAVDLIPLTRDVMFVGEFFTLITTVELLPELRKESEAEEDFAVRLASEFLLGYYGWNVAAVANSIGVMADEYDET